MLLQRSHLQKSSFRSNGFVTVSAPPSTTDAPDKCISGTRTWGLCDGSPSKQTTIDTCSPITEYCSNGNALSSKFINAFIPSEIPSIQVTYNRRPTYITPPTSRPLSVLPISPSIPRLPAWSGSYGSSLYPSLFGGSSGSSSINLFNSSSSVYNYQPFSSLLRRRKRQTKETSLAPKRDLLIMMDESGSVGKTHFEKAKTIAAGIIKILCGSQAMHPDKTRIAVMSFDSKIHLHVPLLHSKTGLNKNAFELSGYLHSIKYNSSTAGRTCLNDALIYARDVALATSGSRRGQKNVIQEIILITDGCSNCGGSLTKTVRDLDKVSGIKIYVIGIALTSACTKKLSILASRGNCYHFFNFQRWDYDVDEFIEDIKKYTRPENIKRLCVHEVIGKTVDMCVDPNKQG